MFIREGAGIGIRWQAGPRIPFSFSVVEREDEASGEVFAFGQWCTPAARDLKAKTARALGYKPREVDISKFLVWMRDREFAYLRRKASSIGGGGAGARNDSPDPDDVRALVTTIECARRAGVGGGLEQSAIVCTTFSPGGAARVRKDGGELPRTCRLDVSARGVSLLLLKDTESWPASEVVLAPLSDDPSGLDFESVANEIRSDQRAITLYYRIRSSREEMAGQGIHAVKRVMLSAEVLAATLGPKESPTKVWLRGLSDT